MPFYYNLDNTRWRCSVWIGGVPSISKAPSFADVLKGRRKPSLEQKTICYLTQMPRGMSKNIALLCTKLTYNGNSRQNI